MSTFVLISHTTTRACRAQVEDPLHISALAYLDYYYTFAAPAELELEGQNGFTYRRLYLTTDYTFSDAFSARARLEANDKSTQPFVKDLSLRWSLSPQNALRFGIIPTPAVELSESVWGFRSLEKTPLDLHRFVSSRDMGVRFDGTALGNGVLKYNVMIGNNNFVNPEDDPYKRMYGLVHASPVEHLLVAVSADYGWQGGDLEDEYHLGGLLGYTSPALRIGVEPFWARTGAETIAGAERAAGIGLFASGWFSPAWGVVGRVDRLQWSNSDRSDQTYGILGIVYQPIPQVRFIPNVYLFKDDIDDDPTATGRVTLEVAF